MHTPDTPHPPDQPGALDPTSAPGSAPGYAELYCRSNFSFLHGASHADELVQRAIALGYRALAITDECTLAGSVRAHAAAQEALSKRQQRDFKLITGSCFRLTCPPTPDTSDTPTTPEGQPSPLAAMTLVALARNREGYGNLCELITLARTREPKGRYRLGPEDFSTPPPALAHLRGLPDCQLILVPDYPADAAVVDAQLRWFAPLFAGRGWLGLTHLYRPLDQQHHAVLAQAALVHDVPMTAVGDVQMHARSRKYLQDVLTAIRVGQPVQQCGQALAPNAEQHLRARERLATLYGSQRMAATLDIATGCDFDMACLRYEYPDELVPLGMTAASYLRQETLAGAQLRYPHGIPAGVRKQLEDELQLIARKDYEAYFLTVYDLVRFARSKGILCQGRGSAANSAVCYCLHITEVNPDTTHLLFARFISEERDEPPDIDVDFEHQRREEVIQHIYRKYGRRRAALAAAVHSYRPRGALREVGRALGVDAAIIDTVARAQHWFDSREQLLERFAEAGLDTSLPHIMLWASLTEKLLGFPRHLSQHSGGFVIARGQLSRLVPIQNAAMQDRSVIEWDKDDLESLKLLKVDVLALGMLSALRRTLELVSLWRGGPLAIPMRLADIPADDPATFEMIGRADTIGVFQIESRAQMSMLPRMLPRNLYDLVIQVAIVRPGPIQGGMVHPYLRRRELVRGGGSFDYPDNTSKSGKIRQVLERTLGIPIFQEQVMEVAIEAASYSHGEADNLRRSMAAWKRKGGMRPHHERLVGGMLDNGYSAEFAESIYSQIQGFGEYGFPESHAASFAQLSYFSSWLKCHEPEAFLCGLLNSQPMGFYSPSQLVQDARRHGVAVLPADVMHSHWESTLECPLASPAQTSNANRPAVRLGLSLLRGMPESAARRIEHSRADRPFIDVAEMAQRAELERPVLDALAAGDALRGLAGHRRTALWQAAGAVPERGLLRPAARTDDAIALPAPSEGDDILGDYRAMNLSLRRHPLALLRPTLARRRFMTVAQLNALQNRQFACCCGLVTVRQRPGTAKGVIFMTLEDETGSANVIIWPALLERQRSEVLNASLLGVYGSWQCQGEVRHLVAGRLEDWTHLLGQLQPRSRDFF